MKENTVLAYFWIYVRHLTQLTIKSYLKNLSIMVSKAYHYSGLLITYLNR